jgi:hypothetical protein
LHSGWDFFVSYTHTDRAWAEWIAWVLEEDGHQVLIQAWDFVPGSNWLAGMHAGTRDAARTIAVLSGTYLGSVYGSAAWQAAMATDPDGTSRKLLVVRVATASGLVCSPGSSGWTCSGYLRQRHGTGCVRWSWQQNQAARSQRWHLASLAQPVSCHPNRISLADRRPARRPAQTQSAAVTPSSQQIPRTSASRPLNPGTFASQDDFYDVDLVLRGRLLLPGRPARSFPLYRRIRTRGRPCRPQRRAVTD